MAEAFPLTMAFFTKLSIINTTIVSPFNWAFLAHIIGDFERVSCPVLLS